MIENGKKKIPMKGVRGKTFNKTDMALLRNVEELRDSGIGGSSSSSNVKNGTSKPYFYLTIL